MTGLIDGVAPGATTPYWSVLRPASGVNLVPNPSFEKDTTGWTPPTGTLVRTAGAGRFGAYGGRFTASALNDYTGVIVAAVNGTTYTCSVYFRSSSSLVYLRGTNGVLTVDQTHPGDGQFHRIAVTLAAGAGAIMNAIIVDPRSGSWTPIDIDGMQIEEGSVATSYIDGDQDGCTWAGTPHGSASSRDGRDGRGGQIVSLDSVGLSIPSWKGTGAPPVDIATLPLALADGEIYQRSTAKMRTVALQGLITGSNTGLPAWHAQRRGILDLFLPDARTNRGPITLRYAGPSVPKLLRCYYQSGLEMDSLEAQTIEKPEIKLLATDPAWYGETEESGALSGSSSLTVGGIARRSKQHAWSAMAGGFGTTATQFVERIVRAIDGRYVAVGTFLNMGGVAAADFAATWNPTTGAWTSLASTTPSARVRTAYVASDGSLYLGGDFTDLAGNTSADRIAKINSALTAVTALSTGATSGGVYDIIQDPTTGYIIAVGTFTTIGGTSTAKGAASWNGSAWTDLTGDIATLGADYVLGIGPDGLVYAASGTGVYYLGTTFKVLATLSASGQVHAITTYRGKLIVAGEFTTIGGVSANNIAAWNGRTWESLGTGIFMNTGGRVNRLAVGSDGLLYAAGRNWASIGGYGSNGGGTPPDSIAAWTGSAWAQVPFNAPATGTPDNDEHYVFALADGSIAISWGAASGTFGSAAIGEGVTTVTNSGSANAYPVLTLTGSGNLYGIVNVTTGQTIRFYPTDPSLYGTMTLDLRPGRKKLTGAGGQNLQNLIPAGSDLGTFCLAPGSNSLALMIDTPSSPSAYWRPSFWSTD